MLPNGFLNQFPYGDMHELNLDWVIKQVKALALEMVGFEAANTVNYDGVWNITKQYQAWTVVLDQESGYLMISTKIVPVGISINNRDYWILVSPFKIDTDFDEDSYNAIANKTVTTKFASVDDSISSLESEDDTINEKIDDLRSDLTDETSARTFEDTSLSNRITANADAISSEATTRASADTLLSSRIDAIASLPEGSTSGDAELIDIRVAYNGDIYSSAGNAVRGQVEDLYGAVDKVGTVSIGKNLIDLSKCVQGFVVSNGTISTEGSFGNYLTTEYIKIEPNTDYVVSDWYNGLAQDDRKAINFFTLEKELVPYVYINTTSVTSILINEDAYYVRISFYNTRIGMLEKGSVRTDFAPYTETAALNNNFGLTTKMIHEIDTQNPLYGKKWIPCGDSFTNYTDELYDSGPFSGKYKTYPRLIAERTGCIIDEDFFKDGRTLAYPADETFSNSLCNPNASYYYQNIPADTDIVTIYLGINDSHHAPGSSGGDGEENTGEIPIGTINDDTTATYYGAWNVVMTWLKTYRPFTKIGIIVSNGCDSIAYRTAQLDICKKYGVPYIDMNGDARTPAMIRPQNTDIPSAVKALLIAAQAIDPPTNTHPNHQAHAFESTFIETFLRSL